MSYNSDRIAELEEEVVDLTRELERAEDEIEVLQKDLADLDDRIEDSYRDGYDKALEKAINAIEVLQ